jgi:large subunit ribosomal protein L21
MYAVIETGGKQYRVAQGDKLCVEKLDGEAGAMVSLDKVLMLGGDGKVVLGKPFVAGAKVAAKVLSQGRDRKVLTVKFRRRKHHMKTIGHRQHYTEIEITQIVGA